MNDLSISSLADEISSGANFARDAGGALYVYRDGFYQSGAEKYIRRRVKEIAIARGHQEKWNSKLAEEVCEYIKADAPGVVAHSPYRRD